jgi:D-lactate dehydrogenase
MKIGFFEIRPGEQDFFKLAFPQDELIFTTDPLTTANAGQYSTLEVVTSHTGSKIDSTVINALPALRLIATRTTGFDHIDTHAAAARNIPVCNVPSYGENTVAEFAFGLILSLSRRIPDAINRVRATKQFDTSGLTGFDLKDQTLGVLGTGKIGSHLIKMAKGFEMNVIAYDAFPNEKLAAELGFRYTTLDEVLSTSKVISVHVPFLPSTKHLLNSENMSKIQKGAILINTARGAVIESQALLNALEQRTISAAALDVLEDEESLQPGVVSNPDPIISKINQTLITLPQVYITPHLAFNSKEALQRILQTTVENIQAVQKGAPINIVKPQP